MAAETTHDITFTADAVVKRYRSWAHGEPAREWAGLTLLDRCAPGLAPKPLEQCTEHGAPAIRMSRVPGRPLGGRPLDDVQLDGLARALTRMYAAVPADQLTGVDERRMGPRELGASLRRGIREPHVVESDAVGSVLEAAAAWLEGPEASTLMAPPADPVFTQADGNLGNFLWDGEQCFVVDFEDSGVSDPAYEVADLLEHVTVWLPALIQPDELVPRLGFSAEQGCRLLGYRRLLAIFWLLRLLPGNPGHARNPGGSVVRQASRVRALLS